MIVAGVVDLAGDRAEREGGRGDEIAPADLGRIELERAGGRVHQPLDEEASPRAVRRRGRPRPASVVVSAPVTVMSHAGTT